MIRPHPLDVGPPEPDWGQRNDDPRDPDPAVTVRAADPDPEPDPEPDWDHLWGESPVDAPPVDEPDPDPAPRGARRATLDRHVFSDPVVDTPGGLIQRPRQRLGSRRGDLETIELAAYYASPKWILVQRRKHNAHWLWRQVT